MTKFLEFVDRHQREGRRQLKIVAAVLKAGGLQVADHSSDEEPYVFVKGPPLSFGGVRVYQVGDMLAYRVAKSEKTEPYGTAYKLDLEMMFNDFMGEEPSEDEAGKKTAHAAASELTRFFQKSQKAEQELRERPDEPGLVLRSGGTDYSSLVSSRA